jgi:hypothetical protein
MLKRCRESDFATEAFGGYSGGEVRIKYLDDQSSLERGVCCDEYA